MLELEEARAQLLARIAPLPQEPIEATHAAGRILAQPVDAIGSVPPFDNSAMDGYALRAEDVRAASPDTPVPLILDGAVAAGDSPSGPLAPGHCRRIFTGSPLPPGADAVIMQEDTRPDPAEARRVWMLDRVRPWENIRFQGEDIRAGTRVLTAGRRLGPGPLGLIAAVGQKQIVVSRQPQVGLLSTGNELVDPGQPLPPGGIYESNRAILDPLVVAAGGVPERLPLVPDTLPATVDALRTAFSRYDVVITTGGVSVGEKDFVREAFTELGGALEFWRVAIKPGKPFCCGQWQGKWLFGLPGNPVSATVTFLLLVRPALLRLQGADSDACLPSTGACRLAEPLHNPADRRHFMRVRVDNEGLARSAGGQASHQIASLALANGLVDVPPRQSLAEGSLVPVLRFGE